jgi:hypothetical protein
MKITASTIVFLIVILTSATGYTAQSKKATRADIPDNLQVHETDVSRAEYERAIEHLQELKSFIRNSKTVPDIVDSSRFYIGYPNSLLRIEGYVLKLEAELAKAKYETAELKLKEGKISQQNLDLLRTKLKETEQAFKDYLEGSSFSD